MDELETPVESARTAKASHEHGQADASTRVEVGEITGVVPSAAPPTSQRDQAEDRPIVVTADGYVGSAACQSCHEDNYRSWHASYHRTMTQVATPQSIASSFDDVELQHGGGRFRLLTDSDELWVEANYTRETSGEAANTSRRRVVLTTGSHHFQVYWLASERSRMLDLFPLVYRIDRQRWMPLQAAFLHPPGLEQTLGGGRWNYICNRCHATHARPRITSTDQMDTHVAEFGIACEACHGPGEQHVRLQGEESPRQIVNPAKLSPARSAEVCGACHSANTFLDDARMAAWVQNGFRYRPGDRLEESRRIIRKGKRQFWSDGMLRVSGREYNGLLESPCFQNGDAARKTMTCLSCHVMHPDENDDRPLEEWADDQLKLSMDSDDALVSGNLACTQCHQEFDDTRVFVAHTHHQATSTGSHCYNCHMPHSTWGVMKAMRSHTVDSPNIQTTLATGRPNACNLCHLDKTLAWTARALEQWYEQSIPEMTADHRSVAASIVWSLQGDAGQRALIAWAMGWEPARQISGELWMVPILAQLMVDPYHAIRTTAHRSMQKTDGFAGLAFDFVGPIHERIAVAQQALETWRTRTDGDPHVESPNILVDSQGQFQRDVFDRLLGQRDNRPVFLDE